MDERITTLFSKYISHDISPSEVEELKAFIAQSGHNKRLFADFLAFSKAETQASLIKRIREGGRWERLMRRIDMRRRRRIMSWVAAAAVAAVLIVSGIATLLHDGQPRYTTMAQVMEAKACNQAKLTVGDGETIDIDGSEKSTITDATGMAVGETRGSSIVYFACPKTPMRNDIEVAKGSTYTVKMPDGTTITLNSGARMAYTIGGGDRSVALDGEAYFQVRHNPSFPFTVACHNGDKVTVLGTMFNVSADRHGSLAVTVESGRVGVTVRGETSYLGAGERLEVSADGHIHTSKADARMYTSWASGIYEFTDAPMQAIARQLTLWYGVKFRFASPELERRTFTGALLRDQNLGYSISLLKEVSGLSFNIEDGEVIISN